MIIESNVEKAKILVKKSQEKPITVKAQNYEFNRKMLEYGKFEVLLFPQKEKNTKRTLRITDSGLDRTSLRAAKKSKIRIGIDLDELRSLKKKDLALELEKLIQNIKLCRKEKVQLHLLNFKDKKDSISLLLSLGSSTKQAKEAVF